MRRKEALITGKVYHILNKSIAGFRIFNCDSEFIRMRNALRYYQVENMPLGLSRFLELEKVKEAGFDSHFLSVSQWKERLVEIIAYGIMPTHPHLILKQLKENGISIFMGNALNSYSRYFNSKYKRKGPLWEANFKNVLIESDEQLLHLTRYIHLNPVTAYLVDKPEEWLASFYKEYLLDNANSNDRICKYEDILDVGPSNYRKFVEDRISYQRELVKIKDLLLE